MWFQYGTKDGILYRLSFDKSVPFFGLVAGESTITEEHFAVPNSWLVNCSVDPMDDTKSCFVSREKESNGGLKVAVHLHYLADHWQLCVGQKLFPGKVVQIRTDDHPLHEVESKGGCFSVAASKEIMNEIETGSRVRVRYTEWPRESAVQLEFAEYGFRVALKMAEWRIGKL